jgi:hypothetical protein
LLETASASVCSKIVAANPQFADAVQDAVTGVVDDINLEVRDRSVGHAKARRRVKLLTRVARAQGKPMSTRLLARKLRTDGDGVVGILQAVPSRWPERAVLHENPGVALVLAKAAGCSWATAKLILLIEAAGPPKCPARTWTAPAKRFSSNSKSERQNACSSFMVHAEVRAPVRASGRFGSGCGAGRTDRVWRFDSGGEWDRPIQNPAKAGPAMALLRHQVTLCTSCGNWRGIVLRRSARAAQQKGSRRCPDLWQVYAFWI